MNSMRINITEEQLHEILLKEETNPYYDRKSSRSQTNLKKIWDLISQMTEENCHKSPKEQKTIAESI